MQRLTNTWRHQKTISANCSTNLSKNEIPQNTGKRRLGRLPITPALLTTARRPDDSPTLLAVRPQTPTCQSNETESGDIPASFLSSFSASMDIHLIQEVEKVEAALNVDAKTKKPEPSSHINFPEKGIKSTKTSNLNSRNQNANRSIPAAIDEDLKSLSLKKDNKLSGKRKYVKTSAQRSLVKSKQSESLKSPLIPEAKLSLACSPAVKKSKDSKTGFVNEMMGKNGKPGESCRSKISVGELLKVKSPNNQIKGNKINSGHKENVSFDDSFSCSEISFSPLCSPADGGEGVCETDHESSQTKSNTCRELQKSFRPHGQEGETRSPLAVVIEGNKTRANETKNSLRASTNFLSEDKCSHPAAVCNSKDQNSRTPVKSGITNSNKGAKKRPSPTQTNSPDAVSKKKEKTSKDEKNNSLSKMAKAKPLLYTKGSKTCHEPFEKMKCIGESPDVNTVVYRNERKTPSGNIKTSHTCNYAPVSEPLPDKGNEKNTIDDDRIFSSVSTSDTDNVSSSHVGKGCKTMGSESASDVAAADIQVEVSTDNSSLTADKLQLSSWGLPEPVLEAYRNKGIVTMFEWQAECLLTDQVLNGGNLVYSAPTSAGKTLVAELLVLKRVVETRRKALFILPFVSVAREKMYSLQALYQDAGIRVGGYMGSHSPPGGFSKVDVAVCTIEKGNGLINRLMEEGKLGDLGVVVVDELHMVGDSHRGYLLELMLTKLAYITHRMKDTSDSQVQIIGMSATLPNLSLLAKWLKASLYHTDFRPVPLTEHIKVDNKILNDQLIVQREIPALLTSPDDVDHVVALCLETVSAGHAVLVFCPTKSWCEKLCETIARKFFALMQDLQRNTAKDQEEPSSNTVAGIHIQLDKDSLQETVEQLRRSPVGVDPMLGRCVLSGVAYHHAGLTFDERDILEGAFRQGYLKVLTATSTLSSGVNLPARRVIIRTPMFHGNVLDTLTYKQMAGRAGRKGVDTQGESVLICKAQEKNIGRNLLQAELAPVESCLDFSADQSLSGSLKRAVLEVVVSGVASSPDDVVTYINCTLLSASLSGDTGSDKNTALVESCIKFLQENEFVTIQSSTNEDGSEGKRFYPTQLGSAILASSLSPDEGLLVFAELQKARRAFVLDTELHIIYLVTPIYTTDVSASIDWYHYHTLWETLTPADRRVAELVGVSESFIARAIRGRINGKTEAQRKSLAVHRRFYTALVLNSLVQECPLMEVAAKFTCNKGQLQSLQQSASTYAGMITVLCSRLGWRSLELILAQFHKRLCFGVQQELVDLVRISSLNASSARMLYNAGYHVVADVARAKTADIENLFKIAAPFQSNKKQDGETDWELNERRRARCIWLTGRKGVTELDAAQAIIEEAKVIVQGDLGVSDIAWQSRDDDSADESNNSSSVSEDRTCITAISSTEKSLRTDTSCRNEHSVSSDVKTVELENSNVGKGEKFMLAGSEAHKDNEELPFHQHRSAASNDGMQVLGDSDVHESRGNTRVHLQPKHICVTAEVHVDSNQHKVLVKHQNNHSHYKLSEMLEEHSSVQGNGKVHNDRNNQSKCDGNETRERRTSDGVEQNTSKDRSFSRAKRKDKSFFGQVVVSPPVGVQTRSRNGQQIIIGSSIKNITDQNIGKTTSTHNDCGKNNSEENISMKINSKLSNSASRTMKTKERVVGHHCEIMSESHKHESVETNARGSHSCDQASFCHGSPATGSEHTRVVKTSVPCQQRDITGTDSDFSFSESFVLDTQTADIVDQNCQDKKQSQHFTTSTGAPVKKCKSSVPKSDIMICNFTSPKNFVVHSDEKLKTRHGDAPDRGVNNGSFSDSLAGYFDMSCNESKSKSQNNQNSGSSSSEKDQQNLFSEPLFDSFEKDNCSERKAEISKVQQLQSDSKITSHSYSETTVRESAEKIPRFVHDGDHQNVTSQNLIDKTQEAKLLGNRAECMDGSKQENSSLSFIKSRKSEKSVEFSDVIVGNESVDKINSSYEDLHINTNVAKSYHERRIHHSESRDLSDKNQPNIPKIEQFEVPSDKTINKLPHTNLNSQLDEEAMLAALDLSCSSFSVSPLVTHRSASTRCREHDSRVPQNSTPNIPDGNNKDLRKKPSSYFQEAADGGGNLEATPISRYSGRNVKEISSVNSQHSKSSLSEKKSAQKSNGLAVDEYFMDSFSSSLMDKVMAECEQIERKDHKSKQNKSTVESFHESPVEKGGKYSKNETKTGRCSMPDSRETSAPTSNNTSKNDGSDCVPPTPPDETASVASPYKMSFYSPLKAKTLKLQEKSPACKGSMMGQCDKTSKANEHTAIKDRKAPKHPDKISHPNLNANKTEKRSGASICTTLIDPVHRKHSSKSSSRKNTCDQTAGGTDINRIPDTVSSTDSSKASNTRLISNDINNIPDNLHKEWKFSNDSINIDNANDISEAENNEDVHSSNLNQCLSASQLLTQQSFTVIDVCASRELFLTFITEWKSKTYFALSLACERRPAEARQTSASVIGGKFVKKRVSSPRTRSQSTVGIHVPDTDAVIVGVAISWENRDAYFISLMPTNHAVSSDLNDSLSEPPLDEGLTQEERVMALVEVLDSSHREHPERSIAVYDSKTAYVYLAKTLGISLPACEDPRVADWLREPGARLKNLHRMVGSFCPEELPLLDAVGGVNGYQSMGCDVKSKASGRLRSCTESVLTHKLMTRYHTLLAEDQLSRAFKDVEMPSLTTLARMELNGFGLSEVECEQQKTLITTKLAVLEQQAYQMAGHPFSLTSTDDMAKVLYIELKLPYNGDPTIMPKLPTTGGRGRRRTTIGSVSKEILQKLTQFHPLPAVLLEWRRLSAALTSSLFGLQRTARLCPKLNMARVFGDCQIFTATGRVSMAEPNLQNVPKQFVIDLPDITKKSLLGSDEKSADKNKSSNSRNTRAKGDNQQATRITDPCHVITTPVCMRKMFIPFQGGVILAADYSQLELRIIAHLSGDTQLASILNTLTGDVFKMIAAQMHGLEVAEVSAEHRQQAKQVCYGMLYGIGPKALGEQLGVDENDAGAFMETFKSRYPGVRKYLRETVEFCQKNGYVKTMFNRRRYLPSIKHSNPHAKAQAERQAVNSTIQGSAADLVKVAMVNIDKKLMELFPDTHRCHSHLDTSADTHRSQAATGGYLVLQLHDELIYEVSADQVQEVARLVKHHMETAVKLSVCMPVKVKVGPSWGQLQDYDVQDDDEV